MISQDKQGPSVHPTHSENEFEALVDGYSKSFQNKLDLAREAGKFYYNGAWLSQEAILAREKARKRAQRSLLVDLVLADLLLAIAIFSAYKLMVVFLIPG